MPVYVFYIFGEHWATRTLISDGSESLDLLKASWHLLMKCRSLLGHVMFSRAVELLQFLNEIKEMQGLNINFQHYMYVS